MATERVVLGELISQFYDEFLVMYGDEELASVATAAVINELLEQDRSVAEQAELGRIEPVH